ncbi:MAG: SAM-dependent methyltransferase [Myxococcota bacterium]|jgi:SAM-dependent methyltransferase
MSTGHFYGVRYHRHMLRDSARTGGYQKAIEALVRPGDVVVDVGAGTGVMSIFAARAGARKVYAIESTPIARLAERIIADSGHADVIQIIEANADDVELPEPADLIVTECMGSFVYSDAMLGVLERCKRMLGPNGKVCPQQINIFLGPTFLAPIFGEFSFWEKPRYGIDFSIARESAVNDTYNVQCPSMQLLNAEPAFFGEIRPTEPVPEADRAVTFTVTRAGPIDTVLGWFNATLADGIVLETGPGHSTHWGQLGFPVPPFLAEVGGTLRFHLTVTRGHMDLPTYSWSGEYTDPGGVVRLRFSRSQDFRFSPELAVTERFE